MKSLIAKPVCERLDADTQKRAHQFAIAHGRKPKLVAVMVGDHPSSQIYVSRKGERARALGLEGETLTLPASTAKENTRQVIERLNQDPRVDGILLQRPLPSDYSESEIVYWINPEKDVDCFHPENVGRLALGLPGLRPCTPAGVIELLLHYKIDPRGKNTCVVGRSAIVGKPMAQLLLQEDATVTIAHSRTRDLAAITRQAEILIVAAGKPGLIGSGHITKGAVVVDVGIHRTADGKVVGDVRADEMAEAAALSPVPGGVGPLTIAVLLQNTIWAAENRAARRMK